MSKTLTQGKEIQDHLFSELSQLLESIASPVRLKIIHFLSQSPHSVEQIAQKLNQSIANTSMHLNKMQRENILDCKKEGQKRIYSLAHVEMNHFWEEIQKFAKIHRPDILINDEKVYGENFNWEENIKTTMDLILKEKAILLDVRPDDEVSLIEDFYRNYVKHIPFSDLKERKKELPSSKEILVFCRGEFCALSGESTFILREMGFKAHKLNLSWHKIQAQLRRICHF